jgi:hypothetical protein
VLPADHYFKTRDGIHDWVSWTEPATTIFTRIASGGPMQQESGGE